MRITFTESAWRDYVWLQENDRKLLKRVNEGIGRPEPLKGELSGCWSRRINQEHRLVYQISGNNLLVIACRYHYAP